MIIPMAAACAPPGSGDGGGSGGGAAGPGVEYGADEQAYAEALKDMDPITLDVGGLTTGPKDLSSKAVKEWTDRLEERSGGKLTFSLDYGGAKVPLDDMAAALSQGRVDVGMYIPAYQPESFPVANGVGSLALAGRGTPVSGRMATFGTVAEIGLNTPEVLAEAEKQGIHPLMPLFVPGHDTKLMCAGEGPYATKEQLSGTTARISAAHQGGVLKSIGASPVSMTFPELFQGLQRGAVDCAVNSVSSFNSGGFDQLINSMSVGSEPGGDFGETPSSYGFSKKTWDALPLAAQQLIYDSMIDLTELQLTTGWQSQAEASASMRQRNIKVTEYGADVTKAFLDFRETFSAGVVQDLAKAGVNDADTLPSDFDTVGDEWWSEITGPLDYSKDYTWGDLDTEIGKENPDARPFVEAFYDKAMKQHRPE